MHRPPAPTAFLLATAAILTALENLRPDMLRIMGQTADPLRPALSA